LFTEETAMRNELVLRLMRRRARRFWAWLKARAQANELRRPWVVLEHAAAFLLLWTLVAIAATITSRLALCCSAPEGDRAFLEA
jgi:hypothetical protein